MKFIRLKSVNWMVAMALLALPGALVTSCSKEATPTENVEPKSDQLVISVKGINNQQSDASLRQGLSSKGKASAAAVAQTIYEFSDVDMAVSVGNNLPVKSVNLASRKSGANGLKANVPENAELMEDGLKYVVYLYEGSNFVKSIELAAGTAGTIDGLNPEGEYTWVALSYSSEEDAPDLEPDTDVALPLNQDVLYAKGTVNLAQQSTIEILFNHVYSRVGIELNTIGVFGEITGTPTVSVSGLNLAAGSLNLLTGVLTPSTTTTEASLGWTDFDRVDPAYGDQMIAYVYTAPVAAQTATLNVQNLSISHADIGDVSRTFFTTATDFSLNVTPQAGQSHHLLLNVLESPLTTSYGGQTVRWGRSNLYYRGDNGGLRDYAFYANNGLTARADGYFPFGGVLPGTFATTETIGDPCALVYPAGLWKSPSKADFSGLVSGDVELNELTSALGPLGQVVDASGITGLLNIVTNLLGGVLGTAGFNTAAPNSTLAPTPYNYAQYSLPAQPGVPTTGTNAFGNAGHPSNNLRFYYNGQVTDATVLQAINNGGGLASVGLTDLSDENQGVIDVDVPILPSYGRHAGLWTNEQGTDILGLVDAGTWGYMATASRSMELRIGIPPLALGDRYVLARNTGELLNGVSALGVDVVSTSLKNVRCVRAPQPTP
ncbi:fimbrillin family protein [Sphingobacterium chuzhouense]|uniref:Fimbrillin-A associated anchor proteins Mfa1 and Mfa2 n=1 Tax=Sphingobacterium chuzhouense TaxID=1742264 RepID=A0ABR7XXD7_9SPHI|nr:fimbrillin family protein [Sphingobacterium chuzhouense]MBD1423722.1 hypothetical protein [Sphingobacterium chuzhouense]